MIIIHRKDHLLILIVLEIIVVTRIIAFTRGNDLLHELNGRVLFLTIFLLLGLYDDFIQRDPVRSQFYFQIIRFTRNDLHFFRIIS